MSENEFFFWNNTYLIKEVSIIIMYMNSIHFDLDLVLSKNQNWLGTYLIKSSEWLHQFERCYD